ADVDHGLAVGDADVIPEPVASGDARRPDAAAGEAGDDDVVPRPTVERVVARAADQDVVSVASEQRIVAGAAHEHVVAFVTRLDELDRVGGEAGRVDDVVSGKCVNGQRVVGRLGAGGRHPGR